MSAQFCHKMFVKSEPSPLERKRWLELWPRDGQVRACGDEDGRPWTRAEGSPVKESQRTGY